MYDTPSILPLQNQQLCSDSCLVQILTPSTTLQICQVENHVNSAPTIKRAPYHPQSRHRLLPPLQICHVGNVNSAPIRPAHSLSSALLNLLPTAATNYQWHKERIASVGMYRQRLHSHVSFITPARSLSSTFLNLPAPAAVINYQCYKRRIARGQIRIYTNMPVNQPYNKTLCWSAYGTNPTLVLYCHILLTNW